METKAGGSEGLAETSDKAIQKEAESISKSPAPKEDAPRTQDALPIEDVPDPDEDDLDDLDGRSACDGANSHC